MSGVPRSQAGLNHDQMRSDFASHHAKAVAEAAAFTAAMPSPPLLRPPQVTALPLSPAMAIPQTSAMPSAASMSPNDFGGCWSTIASGCSPQPGCVACEHLAHITSQRFAAFPWTNPAVTFAHSSRLLHSGGGVSSDCLEPTLRRGKVSHGLIRGCHNTDAFVASTGAVAGAPSRDLLCQRRDIRSYLDQSDVSLPKSRCRSVPNNQDGRPQRGIAVWRDTQSLGECLGLDVDLDCKATAAGAGRCSPSAYDGQGSEAGLSSTRDGTCANGINGFEHRSASEVRFRTAVGPNWECKSDVTSRAPVPRTVPMLALPATGRPDVDVKGSARKRSDEFGKCVQDHPSSARHQLRSIFSAGDSATTATSIKSLHSSEHEPSPSAKGRLSGRGVESKEPVALGAQVQSMEATAIPPSSLQDLETSPMSDAMVAVADTVAVHISDPHETTEATAALTAKAQVVQEELDGWMASSSAAWEVLERRAAALMENRERCLSELDMQVLQLDEEQKSEERQLREELVRCNDRADALQCQADALAEALKVAQAELQEEGQVKERMNEQAKDLIRRRHSNMVLQNRAETLAEALEVAEAKLSEQSQRWEQAEAQAQTHARLLAEFQAKEQRSHENPSFYVNSASSTIALAAKELRAKATASKLGKQSEELVAERTAREALIESLAKRRKSRDDWEDKYMRLREERDAIQAKLAKDVAATSIADGKRLKFDLPSGDATPTELANTQNSNSTAKTADHTSQKVSGRKFTVMPRNAPKEDTSPEPPRLPMPSPAQALALTSASANNNYRKTVVVKSGSRDGSITDPALENSKKGGFGWQRKKTLSDNAWMQRMQQREVESWSNQKENANQDSTSESDNLDDTPGAVPTAGKGGAEGLPNMATVNLAMKTDAENPAESGAVSVRFELGEVANSARDLSSERVFSNGASGNPSTLHQNSNDGAPSRSTSQEGGGGVASSRSSVQPVRNSDDSVRGNGGSGIDAMFTANGYGGSEFCATEVSSLMDTQKEDRKQQTQRDKGSLMVRLSTVRPELRSGLEAHLTKTNSLALLQSQNPRSASSSASSSSTNPSGAEKPVDVAVVEAPRLSSDDAKANRQGNFANDSKAAKDENAFAAIDLSSVNERSSLSIDIALADEGGNWGNHTPCNHGGGGSDRGSVASARTTQKTFSGCDVAPNRFSMTPTVSEVSRMRRPSGDGMDGRRTSGETSKSASYAMGLSLASRGIGVDGSRPAVFFDEKDSEETRNTCGGAGGGRLTSSASDGSGVSMSTSQRASFDGDRTSPFLLGSDSLGGRAVCASSGRISRSASDTLGQLFAGEKPGTDRVQRTKTTL
eukprot:TRINITY_DN29990_c0_g1_i1.p1 TRINITY_DN29990_c0_g1~~TRINITY_DN29990_c0_g1_i1.p1  ORF type:complete len:1332 (-),score=237.12 TRINITY_DN29990_c0_g1_i1:429-4424(-)